MFLDAYKNALAVILKKPIMLWGLSLLSGLLGTLASVLTFPIFALGIIINYLLTCGMAKVYIDGLLGKAVNSDQLFAGFNSKFLKVAGGMAWKSLWVFIWALIPIVGPFIALVKSYSYSFVPYILMTRPEVSATQAIRLSMEMTKGKKLQMFFADFCIIVGAFIIGLVLSLFSLIPVFGVLFSLAYALFMLATVLFLPIFSGLYQAWFYTGTVAAAPVAPAPAVAVE